MLYFHQQKFCHPAQMKISNTKKVQYLNIPDDRINQRLDNLLIYLLKGVPKTRIYRLMRKGEIRINKKRIKPDYRLQKDDILRLPPINIDSVQKKPLNPELSQIQLLKKSIIKNRKHWMAINKPSGIAVHGGSGLSFGVIEGLRSLYPEASYLELVHRLDRDTSGVLLIAKKRSTLRFLHQQLRDKTMNKQYLCVVHGKWPSDLNVIDAAIEKSQGRQGERMMKVDDSGKESITKFQLLGRSQNTSFIKAMPVTGRTHQIRVHCAAAGFPILGDNKYRLQQSIIDNEHKHQVNRLMLHAHQLQFLPQLDSPTQSIHATLDANFIHILHQYQYTESQYSLFINTQQEQN